MKNTFKINKLKSSTFLFNLLTISILVSIFVYVLYRAIVLSFTIDEAFTYMNLRRKRGVYFYNANNHLLNTLLAWFFSEIFGYSEIVLRIPALIGCLMYLVGTYKVSRLICKKSFFQPISVLVLTFNPMLLDFFSLCRGYSLALGFMMLGIYFFLKTLLNQGSITRNNFYSFTLLGLAITTVITFISVFFSIVIICSYLEFKKSLLEKDEKFNKSIINSFMKRIKKFIQLSKKTIIFPFIVNFLVILLLFLFFILPVFKEGRFYYGSKNFIITINSLIEYSVYNQNSPLFLIFEIFIISFLIILGIILISIYNKFSLKKEKLLPKYIPIFGATALLFISIFFIFVQYFIQSIFNLYYSQEMIGHFPLSRTAIFLLPLFFLIIVSSWGIILDEIIIKFNVIKFKQVKNLYNMSICSIHIIYSFFFIFLISNGLININFTHTYQWKSNASLKLVINDLKDLNSKEEEWDVYFDKDSVHFGFVPKYYKKTYDLDWLKINRESTNFTEYDYCVLMRKNLDVLENINYTKTKYYSVSDFYLIEIT